jgi:acetolactate synthase-1/2/3 large subunit
VADAKAALRVLTRVAKEMYPNGFARTAKKAEIAAFRESFKASNAEMQASTAFPMTPERILADTRKGFARRRHNHHGCGLEQERRGPAV